MYHRVELNEQAFLAYQRRAEQMGMTVDEYLNQSASDEPDGFALSPEVREAIEKGLADADAGRLVGIKQVRETLAQYKAKWREENPR